MNCPRAVNMAFTRAFVSRAQNMEANGIQLTRKNAHPRQRNQTSQTMHVNPSRQQDGDARTAAEVLPYLSGTVFSHTMKPAVPLPAPVTDNSCRGAQKTGRAPGKRQRVREQ